ncbi:putative acetyltransferase [Acinetobacter phage BS46]|nr:putative acetyltransferase [Acinetobacter phage BS46]
MSEVKTPDWWYRYKFYSEEDASIEIVNDTPYSTEGAIKFVESLGYEVRGEYNDVSFDPMMGDWRGSIYVVITCGS